MKAKFIDGTINVIDYDFEKQRIENEYQYLINLNSLTDSVINGILNKREEERNEEDEVKLKLRESIEKKKEDRLNAFSDYKELKVEKYTGEVKEYERLEPVFTEEGDYIRQTYKAVIHPQFINELIDKCQKSLADSDYIVIKMYESKLSSSDSPYTQEQIDGVVAERQKLRDRINYLKGLKETEKK